MKYETFISSIATYYAENNLIEPNQIDVFKYGSSLTFASIISFAIAFAWGAVFHCFPEVSVFLLLFIPLRIFSGGYHASTFLRCAVSLVVILALITLSIKFLPYVIVRPLLVVGSISLLYSVFRYSPVQHPNAPIRKKDIPRFRKISLIICIAEISVITVASFTQGLIESYRSLIIAAILSLNIGSFLIYLAEALNVNKEV